MPNVSRAMISFCLGAVMLSTACEEENTPVNNFDIFWRDYRLNYAQFEHKGVDWDRVYDTYRPKINKRTTDRQLFGILKEMTALLNDGHIEIYGDGRYFQSGVVGQIKEDDFDLAVVKKHYLEKAKQSGEDKFTFGWVDEGIGYIHIYQFSGDTDDDWYKGIDTAIDFLKGAKAVIVDVRGNFGGEDWDTYQVLGRFTDKKRATMKTRYRNGPGPDDFGPTKTWYTTPKGRRQFTGPIVLLSNVFSMSAAENFILGMRALPYVTQMGSTSAGAQANTLHRELLNGWSYVVPIGYFTDLRGNCYEGIGLEPEPENRFTNTDEQLHDNIDAVLEAAISKSKEML